MEINFHFFTRSREHNLQYINNFMFFCWNFKKNVFLCLSKEKCIFRTVESQQFSPDLMNDFCFLPSVFMLFL